MIRDNGQSGFFAMLLYTLCAILAIWFPLVIASITTLSWIFWLIYGVQKKHEDSDCFQLARFSIKQKFRNCFTLIEHPPKIMGSGAL